MVSSDYITLTIAFFSIYFNHFCCSYSINFAGSEQSDRAKSNESEFKWVAKKLIETTLISRCCNASNNTTNLTSVRNRSQFMCTFLFLQCDFLCICLHRTYLKVLKHLINGNDIFHILFFSTCSSNGIFRRFYSLKILQLNAIDHLTLC